MEPLARTERAALCNTALDTGAEAPTLCEGWTVKDLVIHLLIRERDPIGGAAIVLSPLEPLAERSARRLREQDFTALVERVRGGPPKWSPMALPPVDRALNGLEYFVHHEDIRRAQPQWEPRELPDGDQRQLWAMIGHAGKGLVRPAGVPVELRWPGAGRDGGDRTKTLRGGEGGAVVSGQPAELAMFL
ncbi:MAG: TIGR03085 family protein, partial [Marmoricola sp.]|nr:TIGR03085 family protein [Marmoricola sp.]